MIPVIKEEPLITHVNSALTTRWIIVCMKSNVIHYNVVWAIQERLFQTDGNTRLQSVGLFLRPIILLGITFKGFFLISPTGMNR